MNEGIAMGLPSEISHVAERLTEVFVNLASVGLDRVRYEIAFAQEMADSNEQKALLGKALVFAEKAQTALAEAVNG